MATAAAPDSEIKVKIGKMIFYITAASRPVVFLLVCRHSVPLLSPGHGMGEFTLRLSLS